MRHGALARGVHRAITARGTMHHAVRRCIGGTPILRYHSSLLFLCMRSITAQARALVDGDERFTLVRNRCRSLPSVVAVPQLSGSPAAHSARCGTSASRLPGPPLPFYRQHHPTPLTTRCITESKPSQHQCCSAPCAYIVPFDRAFAHSSTHSFDYLGFPAASGRARWRTTSAHSLQSTQARKMWS